MVFGGKSPRSPTSPPIYTPRVLKQMMRFLPQKNFRGGFWRSHHVNLNDSSDIILVYSLIWHSYSVLCLLAQSCPTLCNLMDYSPLGSSVHGDSPGKNTGVGCHAFLQGIFVTQGPNPGLPHGRQLLYHLSHQGSPSILEWVAYPFSRGTSQSRNRTGVFWITGGFFTSCATREVHNYSVFTLDSHWNTVEFPANSRAKWHCRKQLRIRHYALESILRTYFAISISLEIIHQSDPASLIP